MKKRRGSWKFSHGGGALFLLAILGPLCLGVLTTLVRSDHWLQPISVVAVSVLAILAPVLWFASIRPLVVDRLWRLSRTWYEAGFAVAVLCFFYATFIFVTGWTPTKYGSRPVPRAHGLLWIYRGCVPLLIGLAAYAMERRRNRPA